MENFTKSQLFKKAWEFKKEQVRVANKTPKGIKYYYKSLCVSFSEALKKAWSFFKNTVSKVSSIQVIKENLLYHQVPSFTHSYKEFIETVDGVKCWAETQVVDNFISDVCDSVLKYKSISEKQAYCIARYMSNNNLTY